MTEHDPRTRHEVEVSLAQRALAAIPLWAHSPGAPAGDQAAGWTPDRRYRAGFWAVFALGLVLFIPNAGSFGLWDPWETHYGEVTRVMVESRDYVSPWWGFAQKIGKEAQQGTPFFSKPVYLFWIEALFIRAIGFSEWAFRLPIALIAWFAAMAVFMAVARISGRVGTGVLAATVTATSPQFFFLARQTQTDMPYAGTMTIALCFFAMAMFAPRERIRSRAVLARVAASLALVLASTLPQYGIIATDLFPDPQAALPFARRLWLSGWAHAVGFGALLAAWLAWQGVALWRDLRAGGGQLDEDARDRWLRRSWLWVFYVLCAHATLAKGLLGFMLPGAIVFVFVLVTGTWRALARMCIPSGVWLALTVGLPWYLAMFAKHGRAYYNRFIVHDHFNRLGDGVHQIDSGTFEHFIKWLGIGMWPWVALVPFAVATALGIRRATLVRESAARLFFFLWFLVAFALFTASSTKFHHYIFPALPALAVMVAWELAELGQRSVAYRRLVTAVGVVLVLAVGLTVRGDVQSLRNLFTYKYDRPLPEHLPTDPDAPVASGATTTWSESLFWEDTNPLVLNLLVSDWVTYERVVLGVGALATLGLLVLGLHRRRRGARRLGIGLLVAAGVSLTLYSLNVYMPMLSPHWSQKHLFEAYYRDCRLLPNGRDVEEAYTPWIAHLGLGGIAEALGAQSKRVCREDVISWLITWRGETFYSNNEIRPISKEATQFEAYLKEFNRGEPFYVLMERGREVAWGRKLENTYLKTKLKGDPSFEGVEGYDVEKIFDENRYFILVKATPRRAAPTL